MLVEVHRYIISIEGIDEDNVTVVDDNNKGEKHAFPSYTDIGSHDDGAPSSVASSADISRSFGIHDSGAFSSPSTSRQTSGTFNRNDIFSEGVGLGRYLDGHAPMHEILWRENVTEEEVLNFVKSSDNHLIFHCS